MRYVFYTSIGIESESEEDAIRWFDYQISQTQLKDVYVEDILGEY